MVAKILAISGSLSRSSSNTELLRAATRLGSECASIEVYAGMGSLPLFNVDLDDDSDPAPAAVTDFRARLSACDGVIISSPEYAHGISGVVKNALDWTVSSGDFYQKPVAVFNASPRASIAQESLLEVLRTMGSRIVEEASIAVPLLGRHLDAEGIIADAALASAVGAAVYAFAQAIDASKSGS
jgi:chromate reductase